MSQSLGVPVQFDHPLLQEARRTVAAAARKYGKFWGLPVANADHAARLYEEEGAQFFNCRSAISLLKAGYQAIRADFDRVLGE